jgi:hypothetical protein
MFSAGVKNIILVVLDMFHEALLQNNRCHLEFLSMLVQLLDNALS